MRFIYTKAFGIFAGCVVALFLFLFLQVKGLLDPVRLAVLKSPRPVVYIVKLVTLPVKSFFGTIYQLREIAKENIELRSKLITLQQSLVKEMQVERENEALRKELGFIKSSKLQLASCSVLSENSFGITNSLILNCGTDDGINLGDAVISQGYLVGKINYASREYSTVLLTIAADFLADAKISENGSSALVKGSYGSGLILDQVPQTTPLEKGWLVITAGINSQIPKNILIGEVGDVISPNSDLFKRAVLISPIDFHNLEFVFVVKA